MVNEKIDFRKRGVRNTESRRLFGRRVIYTEVTDINEGNIINVLQKALFTHLQNQAEIDYLYWYYKGEQPILNRVKEVQIGRASCRERV